jgi:DtxR family Mn-dependent transcriptional regulator
MAWDEVHDIAEELEHIQSDVLIERLDAFLGHPKFDPHGDPIPNAQGRYTLRTQISLDELAPDQMAEVVGVREDERAFLQHLTEKGIRLGCRLSVTRRDPYDAALNLDIEGLEVILSGPAARNILVKPL